MSAPVAIKALAVMDAKNREIRDAADFVNVRASYVNFVSGFIDNVVAVAGQ
jgi:hypothetical protein